MATAATIKKNIAKLEAALKSKATPKSLKSKLETQLVKSKAELSGLNKGSKPKTSSAKSAQSALKSLKELVNKNKKYKNYKGAGVDLERDADRPAKPIGRRTAKASGKTYYEYRANRIDVKQPPKRYPKLEEGGYMAKGGSIPNNYKGKKANEVWQSWDVFQRTHFLKDHFLTNLENQKDEKGYKEAQEQIRENRYIKWDDLPTSVQSEVERHIYMGQYAKGGMSEKPIAAVMDKYGNIKSEKKLQQDLEYLKEAYENKLVTKAEYDKSYDEIKEQLKFLQKKEKGGYMASGGEIYSGKDIKITIPKMGKFDEQKVVAVYDKDNFIFKIYDKDKKRVLTKMGGTNFESNLMNGSYVMENKLEKGGYMAKGGSLSSIKEEYDENEDNNAHSENVVLLAKHFGTKEDLVEAKRILDLHEKEGHLTSENGKKRQELHLKLIEKARTAMDKEGIEFAKGGKLSGLEKSIEKTEKAIKYFEKEKENGNEYADYALKSLHSYLAELKEEQGGSKMAKGGYYAKGGAMEHGLKRGDTIIDDMSWDNSVKVLNNKTGYAVVHLETGERKEMKAMGGEMHRTQE